MPWPKTKTERHPISGHFLQSLLSGCYSIRFATCFYFGGTDLRCLTSGTLNDECHLPHPILVKTDPSIVEVLTLP